MKAEIVTTGTELLLGEIVDTNAAYIARQVREVGVNLYYKTTVGDNRQRLAEVLRLGLSRSDVIIVTGGLGPTVDDITREAVADATGQALELRPEIVERLEQQFARWGRTVGQNNLRQAWLPRSAMMLTNPIGTAPGFIAETDAGAIICMPGVPREMKRMMADHVLPYLQTHVGSEGGAIHTRILHCAGIGESLIDEHIGHLMTAGNPTVGLAAHMGRVDIRLAARAESSTEAEALLAPVEAEIRRKLGAWIYGIDEDTLGSVVAGLLRGQEGALAVVETNTGGAIANAVAEADEGVITASLVADSLADLPEKLGLEQAPTLAEAGARRVAEALQAQTGAEYALALLGSAEPDQGFWTANRGETWLALATPGGIHTEYVTVGGTDEFTCNWLTVFSLNTLRKRLQASV